MNQVKKIKLYEVLYFVWKKYPMVLRWEYFLFVKTEIENSDVKIKVEIKVDDDEFLNFGKVSVYSDNLKKFNKLFGINIDALFGSDEPPKGDRDDGLPNKIAEAAERLIGAAIRILS